MNKVFSSRCLRFSIFGMLLAIFARSAAAESPSVEVKFVKGSGRLAVLIDGMPVAVYCYEDERVRRPYFAHVRSMSGIQVTRNQPPIAGYDSTDHGTFHPALWMSFAELGGSDFWRNLASVKQVQFVEPPRGGIGRGSFAVRNQYLDQKAPSKVICEETVRYTFVSRPTGYLILWDSTFSSDKEFSFGDWEEMGLGIRVATPLRVGTKKDTNLPAGNGTITDSEGRKNEAEIWGNSADWCDYSGTIADQSVGMTILCHPKNFRPSWFHSRDYGMIVANPFGRQTFGKGEKSSIVVQRGEKFRLRFGILVHNGPAGSQPDLAAAYEDYKHLSEN
jgi:hypothetical protein